MEGEMKKKLRLNLRENEHPFVQLTLFIYAAKTQGWSKDEIQKIVIETRGKNRKKLNKILTKYLV